MEKKLKRHVALLIYRAKIVLSLTKDLSRVFLCLNPTNNLVSPESVLPGQSSG